LPGGSRPFDGKDQEVDKRLQECKYRSEGIEIVESIPCVEHTKEISI